MQVGRLMVDVSIELRQALAGLSTRRTELVAFTELPVMSYGFFPGGNGLFEGAQSTVHSPIAALVVGSNFGCRQEFIDDKRNLITQDERANRTWAPMLESLRKAGIPVEECFFTNAWPFLHEGEGNLPKELISAWLKDKDLMSSCLQFFRLTLEKTRPSLIIALGTGPAAFLSHIWPNALRNWAERSIASLDDLPTAKVTLKNHSATCVAITHPSMPNAHWRRPPYRGNEGEIQLLKAAKIQAGGSSGWSESAISAASGPPVKGVLHKPVLAAPEGKGSRGKGLHFQFEQAFSSRKGQVLSKREIKEVLQTLYPNFPDGSVVPTDHAEPSADHVNQCRKCANSTFQIFDTVVDGHGRPGIARYRVRDFKPTPR